MKNLNISRSVLVGMVMLMRLAGLHAQQQPVGFASVGSGTTGGLGGHVLTVSATADFLAAISRTGPVVIQVADTIRLSGMHNVKSDKTIVGVDSLGIITGGGLNCSGVSNIIIQNLLFMDASDDAVNIEDESHHIWVDHCDFTRGYDGLVDIKRGSDYVTVSWNHFTDHVKTCLLGHDDRNGAQDSSRLQASYHHNWFEGTDGRHPRVRWSGLCHVYNNYYTDNSYGVASTCQAKVLVEHCYFKNVGSPALVGYSASPDGDLLPRDNVYDHCIVPAQAGGTVPEPPYVYTPDAAADIPDLLQNGAGRKGFEFVPYENGGWLIYDAAQLPVDAVPQWEVSNTKSPSDTAGWILQDDDNAGNTVLKFLNSGADSRYMWSTDWAMASDGGATFVFRVKPLIEEAPDRVFEIEYRDGALRERLFIKPGGEVELDRADVKADLPYDVDGWHSYRITYKNGVSTVYLDEDPVPFLTGTSTSANTSNDLRFGDGSDGNTYGCLLDWLVWDTSGAYGPQDQVLPEGLIVDAPPSVTDWAVYDASVLPADNQPAFSKSNDKNPPDTTSWIVPDPDIDGNSLLQFVCPSANDSKFMWGRSWGMDDNVGATIAFRVKPLDEAVYVRTFEVEFRDGALRERLFIKPGGEIELDRADVKKQLPYDAAGWHSYRITYQGGVATVYLDENPEPFMSGTSASSSSSNDVRFGDGSDGNTTGFLMDWFVYDVSGVHTPQSGPLPDSLIVDEAVSAVPAFQAGPDGFVLEANWPNPFNPETFIRFHLPRAGDVRVVIYNERGQQVAVLDESMRSAGTHTLSFKAGDLPSGLYFYVVKALGDSRTGKMLLLK